MFFQWQIIPKFLELKVKSVLVKEFLISTKVGLMKVEHLHQKEFFFRDPYFSDSFFGLSQKKTQVFHLDSWSEFLSDYSGFPFETFLTVRTWLIDFVSLLAMKQTNHPAPIFPRS